MGGLILAAGAARRFGSPKQLALLDGRPLLEHALSSMGGARGIGPRAVVLGARAQEILAGVDLQGAEPVIAGDWDEGQAASLRAGIAALAGRVGAVVITLADQPAISAAAIERVIGARGPGHAAVRASYGGRPGHPVLLERSLFGGVARLRGDEGARGLLAAAAVEVVACDDVGSDADVDTVEQLRLSAGGSRRRS